ncbi:MAG TPA: hypothetical protein VGS57_21000 [Thermoanaerobaculia bacterium]|nr:hypothetical protein [Thermoanaerobaculia bacterium]
MIERIVEDELVVVDLTGANANVYYELAIRHAIKRPFVHLIDISEPIPFDISPVRTIHVDIQDLNSVEQAKDELKRQIVAAEAAPDRIENPISMALDLKALRQSTDPVAQAIATLTAETAQLREVVASVRHDFRVLDRMRPLDEIGQALRHLEYKLDDMDFDEAKSAIDDVADKVESLGSAIDEVRDALHGMGS